ncbi:putative ribonuclease H-like domain-containing protein [Tanacetum coccineum]
MNYNTVIVGNQSNGNADPPFSSSSKDSPNAGFKPSREEEMKDTKDPGNEGGILKDNPVNENIVYGCADDPNIPDLKEMGRFKLPNGKRAIGTKWVYRNKKDERGIVIKNKTRLVAQGYTQKEGIDYDEFFAFVARIKAIRLFLAYASFKDFVVYQMDVNSTFLYGKIEEEVYRGKIDKTLFIRRDKCDILLVQVYADDIIFGSTKKSLCTDFKKMMHKKFQMSSMGELTFFLGLQVKQKENEIFISQDKYVTEILKKFGFSDVKTASTPMETHKPLLKDTDGEDVDGHLFKVNPKSSHLHGVKKIFRYLKGQPKLGLWYPKDSPFNLVAYTDSDYVGASLDRKSTTGGCQFLGYKLISWQCKKQIVVANFTTEAEYIAASNCSGHVLWIQNQLMDYGYNSMQTKIHIDNESTIYIVKNPVFHSKIKHIEIRHHFIRDSNKKKLIQMIKIHTDQNVTDLLTKAFDVSRFEYLIKKQPRRKQRKDTEVPQHSGPTEPIADEAGNEESVPTHYNDPLLSGEDRNKLYELMELCTTLQSRVLDLETTKTQAKKIASLKKRVKKLERKRKSKTLGMKRLFKVGRSA